MDWLKGFLLLISSIPPAIKVTCTPIFGPLIASLDGHDFCFTIALEYWSLNLSLSQPITDVFTRAEFNADYYGGKVHKTDRQFFTATVSHNTLFPSRTTTDRATDRVLIPACQFWATTRRRANRVVEDHSNFDPDPDQLQ